MIEYQNIIPGDSLLPRRKDLGKLPKVTVKIRSKKSFQDGSNPVSIGGIIFKIVWVPALFLLILTSTIYSLPLAAREALVTSEEFHKLPGNDFLRNFIVLKGDSMTTPIQLKDGTLFGTKMNVSKPVRLIGVLQFPQRTKAPIEIKIQMTSLGNNKPSLFDDVIKIATDTKSLTLFSLPVPKGEFVFKAICQNGISKDKIPAQLSVTTHF